MTHARYDNPELAKAMYRDMNAERVEEQMRNLRKQGLSLKEIARVTGSSISKVQKVVKDVGL